MEKLEVKRAAKDLLWEGGPAIRGVIQKGPEAPRESKYYYEKRSWTEREHPPWRNVGKATICLSHHDAGDSDPRGRCRVHPLHQRSDKDLSRAKLTLPPR